MALIKVPKIVSGQNRFVHFTAHSSYSLLEGAITIDQLVAKAKAYNMPALAICDSANLFGALEFSKACASNGIKPIVGTHLYVLRPGATNEVFDKLNLYAKNPQGWHNLLKLVSESYLLTKHASKPHVTYDQLRRYSQGLIALTAGSAGIVNKLVLTGNQDEAYKALQELNSIFPQHIYVEISRHNLLHEEEAEGALLEFSDKLNIPIIATNLVMFEEPSKFKAHDTLLCIAQGSYVAVEERKTSNKEYYFKSSSEMATLFADLPEAIENTMQLAERCSIMAESSAPMMPAFAENAQLEAEAIKEQSYAGLKARFDAMEPSITEEEKQTYYQRLEYELGVIIKMQYSGYFLIVSDFILWSKSQGIPVGPGRGSGAGSLVAWCLYITELDPIKFGLIFERFLNPERISMPDFDIDFCQERRDEVINYVRNKYGHARVAQIITFGKLQARAVLRDVGRVLQLPYSYVDRISKLVPHNPVNPVTLSQALEIEPMLAQARDEDPQIKELIEISLQLEGLYRHASTHAAGVVISARDLDQIVALYADPKSDMPVVQYSMKYAEMAGLVKFDFLGLKTLTVIAETCKLLNEQGIKLDINHIAFDDKKTFALLGEGLGVGVFQFESKGMRDSLIKLKPDTLHEIIALGALYRPGPMENIPRYIACKHGIEQPDYPHPKLVPLLSETYGVIIYQEQVLEIAKVLAGYSLGAADLLRRAMGKKIKAEMDAQCEIFVSGAVQNGLDKNKAKEIFELVAKFAGYGFNKAHAAAYGVISYQTAYLKANYPAEFLVASMNLELHDSDKLYVFCQEARRLNIKVLPADINFSQSKYSVELLEDGTKAIRYGLAALKNVGISFVDSVVAERSKNGQFTDPFELAERLDPKQLNRRALENLIKSGALDKLSPSRASLVAILDSLVGIAQASAEEKNSDQHSLFGALPEATKVNYQLPEVPEFERPILLQGEYEAYGFYLFNHPLAKYGPSLELCNITKLADIEGYEEGVHQVWLAGVVVDFVIKLSKRGRFSFVTLSDLSGSMDIAIYDEAIIDQQRHLLEKKQEIAIKVELRREPDNTRVVAVAVHPLAELVKRSPTKLSIKLPSLSLARSLAKMLLPEGVHVVEIMVPDEGELVTLRLEGKYHIEDFGKLEALVGEGNMTMELMSVPIPN